MQGACHRPVEAARVQMALSRVRLGLCWGCPGWEGQMDTARLLPAALWPQELPRLLRSPHVTQAGNQSHLQGGRQAILPSLASVHFPSHVSTWPGTRCVWSTSWVGEGCCGSPGASASAPSPLAAHPPLRLRISLFICSLTPHLGLPWVPGLCEWGRAEVGAAGWTPVLGSPASPARTRLLTGRGGRRGGRPGRRFWVWPARCCIDGPSGQP